MVKVQIGMHFTCIEGAQRLRFLSIMRKKEMLTTRQVADEFGVAYRTVMSWIYKGYFPGALKEESPRGSYYLIPRSDLTGFRPRRRGRPKPESTSSKRPSRKASAKKIKLPEEPSDSRGKRKSS